MDYDFLPDTIIAKPAAPNPGKIPGTLAGKTLKAVALVVNHGVEPKEAYTLVNGKEPKRDALDNLKERVRQYSLQTPQMQKLARNAVRDALEGKAVKYDAEKILSNGKRVQYQEVVAPTYTNKLAAAAMVHDRVDPIVRRSENLNINAEMAPVDLSRYRVSGQ